MALVRANTDVDVVDRSRQDQDGREPRPSERGEAARAALAVNFAGGTITVRGVKLTLTASGEQVRLGGSPERHAHYAAVRHDIYPIQQYEAIIASKGNPSTLSVVARGRDPVRGAGHPRAQIPTSKALSAQLWSRPRALLTRGERGLQMRPNG